MTSRSVWTLASRMASVALRLVWLQAAAVARTSPSSSPSSALRFKVFMPGYTDTGPLPSHDCPDRCHVLVGLNLGRGRSPCGCPPTGRPLYPAGIHRATQWMALATQQLFL